MGDANFTPEFENYIDLTYLRFCCMPDFPFIADDFDSLTTYQKICKIVEYLNKVIKSQKTLIDNVEGLYNAFVALQDYVNNYFNNLDIQAEVNNKLQAMYDNGDLTTLISLFLQAETFKIYDTYKGANGLEQDLPNLVLGQHVETLGYNSIGDGGEGKFIVTDTLISNNYQIIINVPNTLYLTYLYDSHYDKALTPELLGFVNNDDISNMFNNDYNNFYNTLLFKKDSNFFKIKPRLISENDGKIVGKKLIGCNNTINVFNDNAESLVFKSCNIKNIKFVSTDNSNTDIDVITLEESNFFEKCQFEIQSRNTTPDLITLIKQISGINKFENCIFSATGMQDQTPILINCFQNQDPTNNYMLSIRHSTFNGGKDGLFLEPQTDLSFYNVEIIDCYFNSQSRYIADIHSNYNIFSGIISNSRNDAETLFNIDSNSNFNKIECLSKSTTNPYYNNEVHYNETQEMLNLNYLK